MHCSYEKKHYFSGAILFKILLSFIFIFASVVRVEASEFMWNRFSYPQSRYSQHDAINIANNIVVHNCRSRIMIEVV